MSVRCLASVFLMTLATSSCSQRAATSPEAAGPPPYIAVIPPGPVQDVPLETPVRAVVTTGDPLCDPDPMRDAPDPCTRFRITATRSAILSVTVTWDGPARLTLWMNGERRDYAGPSMNGRIAVAAGDIVTIAVALHANAPRQEFVLIAHET